MELNEQNFQEVIGKQEQAIVLFYREEGCSFCEQFKPIYEAFAAKSDVPCLYYKLGPKPDSVATAELVTKFPTTVAYVKGQVHNVLTGVLSDEQLANIFNKQIEIATLPMRDLILVEADLIDKMYPLKAQLKMVQLEMEKRRG